MIECTDKNPMTLHSRKLTPREREILELLARGHYYREIGDALEISVSTVRSHLHSVYRKLEVKSRTQAVSKLLRRELNFSPGEHQKQNDAMARIL